jgi:ADP-heptose:LPS heptosyltransferase
MSCDLIITSDTAVAHLAGALGVRTWVALKYVPDWRWFRDREDSPWYPSMRLFRQEAVADWDGVFQRIKAALVDHVETSSSRPA